MGGLSKKSYQLKQIINERKQQVLIVDAGNLLFKKTAVSEPQDLIAASGMMEIYKRLAVDAVAVGPHDLAAGLDFLKEAQSKGFPWLSANIVDAQHNPVFNASKIVKRAGLRIGIIGLTEIDLPNVSGITVAGWQQALSIELSKLEKACDLVVVLTSLSDQDNAELMKNYPQVHILLTANQGQGNIKPRIINSTLHTQTHSQGKYLGVLDLNWNPLQPWKRDFDQEDLLLNNRLSVLDRQILRAERLDNKSIESEAQLQAYRQERENLLKAIEELKTRIANSEPRKEAASSFDSTFISLTRDLPDDPEIAEQVRQINDRINSHNQQSLTGQAMQKEKKPAAIKKLPEGFSGSARCSECHVSQTDFWKNTGHAGAFQTLVQQRQDFNLDCLPCHVTHDVKAYQKGTAEKVNLAGLPPELRGVGCESCHGPGEEHSSNPMHVQPGTIKVEEAVCLNCHSERHSPDFSFASATKVSCPAD